jgi:hypothetical protein
MDPQSTIGLTGAPMNLDDPRAQRGVATLRRAEGGRLRRA